VGCEIAKDYRHRGHGTAAVRAMVKYGFEERGFSAITAKIEKDNHISQDCAWKAGFFSYAGPIDGHLLFAFDRSRLSQAA
jgi:RimJ/RimL family protein N-acetyltransferase